MSDQPTGDHLLTGARLTVRAPLDCRWPMQYTRLWLAGVRPGQRLALTVDGCDRPFQYSGRVDERGAEVVVRLELPAGATRVLDWSPGGDENGATDLKVRPLSLDRDVVVASGPHRLVIPANIDGRAIPGIIGGFGAFAFDGQIIASSALRDRQLERTARGPLFDEYRLRYRFEADRHYTVMLRCYRDEPIVEVHEQFRLLDRAVLRWTLNPKLDCDRLLTHADLDFQYERELKVGRLDEALPDDLLLRVQMPAMGMYIIPRNRAWFSLFSDADRERGMCGLMALDGGAWQYPADNLMRLRGCGGKAVLEAPLEAGRRQWLLYQGPTDTKALTDEPHVFHRLHAQWNEMRLDEHLDLADERCFDSSSVHEPCVFTSGDEVRAAKNVDRLSPLSRFVSTADTERDVQAARAVRFLMDPTPTLARSLRDHLFERFERWVRQFQGHRKGEADYSKGVVGFARMLRRLMLEYELLRRAGMLSEHDRARLGSYFVFASRRLLDEGRWPYTRTWLHPDHPESVRPLYSYPGERAPDRFVWTSSLPNFQSDTLCALAHLGCLLPDHPDAARWRRLGVEEIDRQLDAYCSPDGAWEESILYTLYTLSYFVITFRALKHGTGRNFFRDARVRRLLDWLVRFFGPRDVRFGTYTFAPIGNTRLPTNHVEPMLACAMELDESDPLRRDLIAVYQRCERELAVTADVALVMAAMVDDVPKASLPLRPLASQVMRDLGVAMRHHHAQPDESYLFQKIGCFKDHYEADETSINWYAKGVPLVMDYGAYTPRCAVAATHNLVEVTDMDPMTRGFLTDCKLGEHVDYTCCQTPVVLKLLHGRVRRFEEIDAGQPATHFYIGDDSPRGPKVWKTRMLMFVKPDYLVMFDRVVGPADHRFNLHVTAEAITRDGSRIDAAGRFGIDLACFVQHPRRFDFQVGSFAPLMPEDAQSDPQRQQWFRLYNRDDDVYRTVLFARAAGQSVRFERIGEAGVVIESDAFRDVVFLSDQFVEHADEAVRFTGRAGWVRRCADGRVVACVPDGERIEAFNRSFS